LEKAPIFEIVIPYNVMAVLVSTFKSPNTLHLLRPRCDYIAGVGTCLYHPLDNSLDKDAKKNPHTIFWEDNDLLDQGSVVILSSFFDRVAETLKEITGHTYIVTPTYVETVKANHQRGHLDDEDAPLREKNNLMYVLHIPLTAEGRVLRVWSTNNIVNLVHTSFGRARMLRADVIHGGCYGRPGNSGLAVKFVPKSHTIENKKLLHIHDAVFPTTPDANMIHDLAWGHVKSTSLGKACPSAKYISKFKQFHAPLFRNGQDPTILAIRKNNNIEDLLIVNMFLIYYIY
jgi:hypothetical protein